MTAPLSSSHPIPVPALVGALILVSCEARTSPGPQLETATVAVDTNAYKKWIESPTGEVHSPAEQLVPTLQTEGIIAPEAMLAAMKSVEGLEAIHAQLAAGLTRPNCQIGAVEDVFPILNRSKTALALALVRAYRGEVAGEVIVDVIRVGHRLAHCQGTLLSGLVGQAVRRDGQEVAFWLTERGLLTDSEAAAVARELDKTVPSRADIERILNNELETNLRYFNQLLGATDSRIYSATETERMIRAQFDWLIHAVNEDAPGWKDEWNKRGKGLLTDEDRSYLETVQAASEGDIAKLAASLLELGTPPSPNIMGRFIAQMILPPASPLSRAKNEIQMDPTRAAVYRAGTKLVAALRAKKALPRSGDGVVISENEARATTPAGDPVVFVARLDGPAFSGSDAQDAPRELVKAKLGQCREEKPGRYVLDEKATAGFDAKGIQYLGEACRLVPSFKNGKANGFKLFGFEPGSFLYSCGLRPGDVVVEINGMQVTSPEDFLDRVLPSVSRARKVHFLIERKRARMELAIRAL